MEESRRKLDKEKSDKRVIYISLQELINMEKRGDFEGAMFKEIKFVWYGIMEITGVPIKSEEIRPGIVIICSDVAKEIIGMRLDPDSLFENNHGEKTCLLLEKKLKRPIIKKLFKCDQTKDFWVVV